MIEIIAYDKKELARYFLVGTWNGYEIIQNLTQGEGHKLKPYTKEESENIDKVIEALIEKNKALEEKLEKLTEKPTEAKGLPKEIDHSNEIFSFVHCRKCVEENEPYPMIECGWTKFGFRVMCRNHNHEITFFPLPPERIPVGCDCEKCQENET